MTIVAPRRTQAQWIAPCGTGRVLRDRSAPRHPNRRRIRPDEREAEAKREAVPMSSASFVVDLSQGDEALNVREEEKVT